MVARKTIIVYAQVIMNAVKNIIKRLIPESWWKHARHLYKWLYPRGIRQHDVGFIRAFWSFIRALLKQNITISERLDYPKAHILITIPSTNRFPRLNAATKEPETIAWLESALAPGDVFYDIGANIGAYSLIAAAHTKGQATIYAFEPNPGNFADLCHNIKLNSFDRCITPFYTALSNTSGLAHKGYIGLAAAAGVLAAEKKLSLAVPGFSLDDLVAILHLSPPNILKLDVDGAELLVLRGARKTLGQSALRSVLVEINEMLTPSENILAIFRVAGFGNPEKHRRNGSTFNYIFRRTKSSTQ